MVDPVTVTMAEVSPNTAISLQGPIDAMTRRLDETKAQQDAVELQCFQTLDLDVPFGDPSA